jgi:hypothetical protein
MVHAGCAGNGTSEEHDYVPLQIILLIVGLYP